jgi:hypothetical protein
MTGAAAMVSTIDDYMSVYRQLLDPLATLFSPGPSEIV